MLFLKWLHLEIQPIYWVERKHQLILNKSAQQQNTKAMFATLSTVCSICYLAPMYNWLCLYACGVTELRLQDSLPVTLQVLFSQEHFLCIAFFYELVSIFDKTLPLMVNSIPQLLTAPV